MADTNTTNLNLVKPEVGASSDTWGTKINSNADAVDALFDSGPVLKVSKGGTGASTAAGARTALGLGSIATQAADAVAITGGAISGITDLAIADGGTGASTAAGARTNLGLGALATLSAVGASEITDGAVGTAELADNSVTGAKIALGSDAQGDIMYYNGTDWVRLPAGTAGQLLQTNGAAANPQWVTASGLTIRTPVAMSGLGSTDFTSIPSSARRITVVFQGISFSVASTSFQLRLGTSAGVVSTGYASQSSAFFGTGTLSSYSGGTNLNAFSLPVSGDTAALHSGRFSLVHMGDNIWVCDGMAGLGGASSSTVGTAIVAGSLALSGALDRLRVLTFSGTFDAGSVTIMYE